MPLIECPECKRSVSDKAESCPACGFPFKPQQVSGETAGHGVPALLSFFIPGLGQLVRGQILEAITVWIMFGFTVLVVREVTFFQDAQIMWLILIWAVIWIRQIVDAYRPKQKTDLSTAVDWFRSPKGMITTFVILSVLCVVWIVAMLSRRPIQ